MTFQRPSKDPTTWQAWTAHDHTAAAQRLWEMALLEFTGQHTVKVSGLLQEAEVHLCRAKLLLVQAEINRSAAAAPLATIPNWREGPGVFRDDAGVALNPIDFGKVPGEKITASYVREHPEMPWPQWMLEMAGVVRTDGEDH